MNRTNFFVTFFIALFAIPAFAEHPTSFSQAKRFAREIYQDSRVRFTVDVAITMKGQLMLHLADMNQGSNRNKVNA